MARISKAEKDRRIRDTERHLVSLGRAAAVEEALSKRYSVTERTVRRWITEVREKWAQEAREEEEVLGAPLRENRRLHIREMLLELYAKAQSRTEVLKDKDGNPVLDAKGRPVVRPNPNYNASLQVVRQLRALDALDQPKVKVVHHRGAIGNADPDADRSPEEDRFFLEHGRWPTKKELAAITGA